MTKSLEHVSTNTDLITYAKLFNIPKFWGVFMRDSLHIKVKKYEEGIYSPVILEEKATFIMGLIDLITFSIIPNIHKKNNNILYWP